MGGGLAGGGQEDGGFDGVRGDNACRGALPQLLAERSPKYLILRYTVGVKIISNSALRRFAAKHRQADEPLQGWRRVIEKNQFDNWAELKTVFNAVDKVGALTVFDIGGNKYRLIAYIRFEKQIVYIKAVLTHREYDKGAWKS